MRHKICFHLPGAQRVVALEQRWLQAIVAPLWNTFESCKCKHLILAELLKGWPEDPSPMSSPLDSHE